MGTDQASLLLKRQLQELAKKPVEGFSAGLVDDDNLFKWEVMVMGPNDSFYEGGFFKAHLIFPPEYPQKPPKMKFISEFWHPNVSKEGDVCISILHEPGEDKYGYERAEERWLPIHTVETILLSVISMISEPNDESPANVDAAKEWREEYENTFKKNVRRCVRKSQEFLWVMCSVIDSWFVDVESVFVVVVDILFMICRFVWVCMGNLTCMAELKSPNHIFSFSISIIIAGNEETFPFEVYIKIFFCLSSIIEKSLGS